MKKILLLLLLIVGCSCLVGCWNKKRDGEAPQISSICPEGFYWFDSIKTCLLLDKEEVGDIK